MSAFLPRFDSEQQLCIDPKLTQLNGGWIESPYHHEPTPSSDCRDDFKLDLRHDQHLNLDASAARPERPRSLSDVFITAQDVFTAPLKAHQNSVAANDISAVCNSSNLKPEAEEFVPSAGVRPRLTLQTKQKEPATKLCNTATPLTPDITVCGLIEAHGISSGRVQRRSRSASNSRRRGSPVQRSRGSFHGQHLELDGLLSPLPSADGFLDPEQWVIGNAYHPGDHLARRQQVSQHSTAPTTPRLSRQAQPSVSTPSTQDGGPYYCDFAGCKEHDKLWDKGSDLRHHKRKHVLEKDRPHGCPKCKRRFWFPKDVRRHMRDVHDESQIKCPICPQTMTTKTFSRLDNLQRHMRNVHSDAPTPSIASESSAVSPSPSPVASLSPAAYSGTSITSAFTSSSLLAAQTAAHAFQQRLDVARTEDPFVNSTLGALAFPPPMLRWHSNRT